MNSYPKVTVAIPVYNVELYVAKSINSVLEQDYDNIELLVVYDVSNDDSLEITKELLGRSRFPYRIIEKDVKEKGLGKSRNVVLDVLNTDYLYFLDSDDYIEPYTISLMVKEAVEKDADIVVASHESVDEMGKVLHVSQLSDRRMFDKYSLKKFIYQNSGYYPVYAWNKLYKSSFLKDNKLRFIHNIVEDAIFSFVAIECVNKLIMLSEITLHYLIRDSSLTNSSMNNNTTLEAANVYLSIRDYKFNYHKDSVLLFDLCNNIDAFGFGYIMTVRNSYNSNLISKSEKNFLCKSAFKTPSIPLTRTFALLYYKKANFLLLIFVKLLPDSFNMLLVKLYSKIKKR